VIRYINVTIIALLSAGLLTFCAPHPAHAATYVPCAEAIADADKLIEFIGGLTEEEGAAAIDRVSKTEYGRVVLSLAASAAKSGDHRAYLRAWHSACLKLTA
jgi:hypothetical protein